MLRTVTSGLSALFMCGISVCATLTLATSAYAIDAVVTPVVKDLKNPESVCIGAEGKIPVYYVTVMGERDTPGDGVVMRVQPGKAEPFATGLDDPKGIAFHNDTLYVADVKKVVAIDPKGKVSVIAAPEAFPIPPLFLNDIAVDQLGNVYVTDTGDRKGAGGGLFRISNDGKVTAVVHATKTPEIKGPNGVLVDDIDHVLLADMLAGIVYRVTVADGSMEKIAEGFQGADGLARDWDGNLYLSQVSNGNISVLRKATGKWEPLKTGAFTSANDICLNYRNGWVVVPDMKGGTISTVSFASNNPRDVDESPLASVGVEVGWPELPLVRAIMLTNAGDGSGRKFVASQMGKVYVLPDDESATEAKLFFDMESKVFYKDNENEQGFLGMAFHPKFKENGEFFVYYSTTEKPLTSVISRFKVDPSNPTQALASSEEEIMRIDQPFWNHNGGTLAFGPDGYLYVGLGDGGKFGDPYGNAQNLSTLLGSILRIDVDHRDGDKAYSVPKDNPFVSKAGAAPEIYAYGVRNIWRLAFDRADGTLWAADVGQDIWEEINVVTKGGNFGWNPREAMHQYGPTGSKPMPEFIEPLWEYHHDIGRSITGGYVYRGKKVPALVGKYVYADYVTGRIWAFEVDAAKKKVVSNREIMGNVSPVMSFGEDEDGELYFMTINGTRDGRISRFVAK